MNAFWVVMKREIVERRMAFVAALVAGLLALLTPLFFEKGSQGLHEARAVSALIAAAAFGLGAALLFGGSVLVRDLAEKRLGFYFGRPLHAFAIWAGKISAAIVMTFALGLLGLLPTLLVESDLGVFKPEVLPFEATLVVFVVVAADVVAAALRSRSPWLLIDLVLVATVVAAVVWVMRKLFAEGWWGFGPPHLALVTLVVSLPVLILLAASLTRVAVGRTDIRRAHGAQSVTLWSLALPLTAALVGYTAWLSSPAPEDLITTEYRKTAPRGGWEVVGGPVRHRGNIVAAFLRKVGTGYFVRLSPRAGLSVTFSADGHRAAWVERIGGGPRLEVVAAELGSRTPKSVRTGLTLSDGRPLMALSPDGRRLAVRQRQEGLLTVYEIPNPALPKSLGAARVPDVPCLSLSFEEERVLISCVPVFSRHQESPARSFVFDIPSRNLSEVPPAAP